MLDQLNSSIFFKNLILQSGIILFLTIFRVALLVFWLLYIISLIVFVKLVDSDKYKPDKISQPCTAEIGTGKTRSR